MRLRADVSTPAVFCFFPPPTLLYVRAHLLSRLYDVVSLFCWLLLLVLLLSVLLLLPYLALHYLVLSFRAVHLFTHVVHCAKHVKTVLPAFGALVRWILPPPALSPSPPGVLAPGFVSIDPRAAGVDRR